MKKNFSSNLQSIIILILVSGLILLALSGYMSPMVSAVLSPFVSTQGWVATRFQAIYEFVTVPRDVASLRARNQDLENEVALLQTQVISLQQQLREAQVLYALLDFARARPQSQYIAASVIGRDPSPFLHYIIIDHGSDSGIRHGMPVVTQQGLVGKVDAVTAGAARVQLISDPGSVVNVRFQKGQVEAQLSGSLTGDISVQMVPQDVSLQPGDLLLTSGLGGIFPSDLVVGQIISSRKRENDLFQTASIQPAVDFANLRAVLIVTNFKPIDVTPLTGTPSP